LLIDLETIKISYIGKVYGKMLFYINFEWTRYWAHQLFDCW